MNPAWRVCPGCGAALDRKTISFTEAFACPKCGEKLRVKQAGFRVRGLTVFLLSPLLAYGVGVRGLGLVIASALALWPLSLVSKLIVNAVFPPRVVARPSDAPEINRCPRCRTELVEKLELGKPFACPACGERLKVVKIGRAHV
jgi:DNA-directed RNA polymerase subunit RPC12/RpoP